MSQTVRAHGGGCCGMTHIVGFLGSPNIMESARVRTSDQDWAAHVRLYPYLYHTVNDERPVETGEQRLRELVRLIPLRSGRYTCGRTSGIIEVVLTTATADNWRELLTELGFNEVNQHVNSNSGRVLHVFHKNTGA